MDGAMDEVVADACEMMLRDSEAVQRLAKENRSLAEKIRDWIGDFVEKVRAAFAGDRATHAEARARLDRMDALQQLWDDALVDAAKANAAKENTAGDGGVQEQARQAYENTNLAEDSEVYDYDFLTSLPDMRITELPEVPMIRDAGGKVNSAAVITEGMKNARSVGGERDGKLYVQNAYTGRQLRIDTSSIRHGLNGGINRLLTNARLGAVIGDVVQNAVPVNALHNKAKGLAGTYAMAAYANDSRNREFVAIVTVEQRSGNISGLESYDVTHAVSGRQKNSSQADTKSQGVYPIKAAEISIADFLSIVNSTHQSILSDDVLQHLGETRNPNGDYSGQVKFSPREPGDEMHDGVIAQEITSGKTSIKQVAGLFKDKNVKFGKANIDVGGGRFNLVTEYLAERGTENMVFDPYNRGIDENTETLRYLQSGNHADTATCANVLNVIREADARANVILEVAKCIGDNGTAYFTVYEGDGSGVGKRTSAGWQNNRKTPDYIDEISRYFDHVQRKGKLIIATQPKSHLPKASWEVEPGRGVQYSERDNTRTERDILADATDGDANTVREMEMLREYKEKLGRYTALAQRLEQQRELVQTAESKDERLRAKNRADNLASLRRLDLCRALICTPPAARSRRAAVIPNDAKSPHR